MVELSKVDEEIEIYKKNFETVCDIYSLYDILERTWRGIALETIILKIVKDFEDEDNYIPYKIDNGSLDELMNLMNEKRKEIETKYKNEIIINGYLENRMKLERKDSAYQFLEELYSSKGKKEYNLIKKLLEENFDKISIFLDSEIDKETRKDMFNTFLYSNEVCRYTGALKDVLSLKSRKGIKELIDNFNTSGFDKMKYVEYLLKSGSEEKLLILKNYVDLYSFSWNYSYNENEEAKRTRVLLPAIHSYYTKSFNKDIYLDPNYLNATQDMKDNTDEIIIRELENIDDISNAVSLKEFELNDKKLKVLTSKVLNKILLIDNEEEKLELYNKFKDIISRKAHNKEEYLKYLNYYEQHADYKKAQEEKKKEKESLIESRQALTALLSNLNNNLQETTPGKRLIKEVYKKD